MPHVVPSQAALPFMGLAQGVQLTPQELRLMLLTHMPLQLCVPPGHTPLQARFTAMQAPAHSLRPAGQAPPHEVPSQVALPPVGTGHGVHDMPHDIGSLLLGQALPQAWKPT